MKWSRMEQRILIMSIVCCTKNLEIATFAKRDYLLATRKLLTGKIFLKTFELAGFYRLQKFPPAQVSTSRSMNRKHFDVKTTQYEFFLRN